MVSKGMTPLGMQFANLSVQKIELNAYSSATFSNSGLRFS
jgi:hypothetical protein